MRSAMRSIVVRRDMITRVARLLAAVSLSLAGLVSLVSPVFAIANPLTPPDVKAINAYRDLLETGDTGFLIDYYLDYAALPTETATVAYLVILRDTTGAQMRSTNPVAFVPNTNKGYRRGAAWIYFTAAESANTTWGAAYTVEIAGNPTGVTWPGVPPSGSAGGIVWSGLSGPTQERQELATRIVWLATAYGAAWSISMVTPSSGGPSGLRLDTYGQQYFQTVIPNCQVIAPDAFPSSLLSPIMEDLTYSTTFNGTVANGTSAPPATNGTVAGSPFNLVVGSNNINVTGLGNLTVTLGKGVAGTASSDVCSVSGTPAALVAGANTITTVGVIGNIVITLTSTTTQSNILTTLIGTPLDMTALGASFGVSRSWTSSLGWFFGMGVFLYYVVKYLGSKVALIFADALIVFGGLLGMTPLLLTVGLFIIFGVLTGFVLLYNRSSA